MSDSTVSLKFTTEGATTQVPPDATLSPERGFSWLEKSTAGKTKFPFLASTSPSRTRLSN